MWLVAEDGEEEGERVVVVVVVVLVEIVVDHTSNRGTRISRVDEVKMER